MKANLLLWKKYLTSLVRVKEWKVHELRRSQTELRLNMTLHFLAVWLWEDYLTFLSSVFLFLSLDENTNLKVLLRGLATTTVESGLNYGYRKSELVTRDKLQLTIWSWCSELLTCLVFSTWLEFLKKSSHNFYFYGISSWTSSWSIRNSFLTYKIFVLEKEGYLLIFRTIKVKYDSPVFFKNTSLGVLLMYKVRFACTRVYNNFRRIMCYSNFIVYTLHFILFKAHHIYYFIWFLWYQIIVSTFQMREVVTQGAAEIKLKLRSFDFLS